MSRLTRTRRRQVSLGVQYALFALVVLALLLLTDWGAISENLVNLEIARQLFPEVLTTALKNTAVYTLLGFSCGLVLGLVIALMRLSRVAPYRWFANTFIEIFRGLPALLVLFIIAYGVPFALGAQFPGGVVGSITVGLGLVGGAYMAETIRAGIQAVPKGQMEAARSLGMSHTRAMISIVIPQAFRIVVPPLTNELILLTKDSSLIYVLGLQGSQKDLTKFGRDALDQFANPTPLVVAGLCYLIITLPLSALVRRLEARNAKAR
ncbi:MAG: amino acid ABC transporter permease [Actinomycetes bacterium]